MGPPTYGATTFMYHFGVPFVPHGEVRDNKSLCPQPPNWFGTSRQPRQDLHKATMMNTHYLSLQMIRVYPIFHLFLPPITD